jgi:hypothetical protein
MSSEKRHAKERLTPRQVLTQPGFRARLAARSLEDDEFRRMLAAHPRAAIESELSMILGRRVRLPRSIQLKVHQESPGVFHFVCPGASLAGPAEDNDLLIFWEHVLRPVS